jgi:hypothetical protein
MSDAGKTIIGVLLGIIILDGTIDSFKRGLEVGTETARKIYKEKYDEIIRKDIK